MFQSLIRNWMLQRIQDAGRRQGAPILTFPGRTISIPGEYIDIKRTFLRETFNAHAFYLALPPNVFGVVNYPDGTSHNMEGGLHEVAPGLYHIQYIDKHERLDFLAPISELATDGEKLTLTVVLRYRVINPLAALQIEKPVETLIEHVAADVAQYIRTHHHSDIADSSEHHEDSKLLSFFVQRHNRRFPLSRAFMITGVEIKDFGGDNEYVAMRRKASMDLSKTKIEKQQTELQQELIELKTRFQTQFDRSMAEHKADIEKIEANHQKEKQEILDQVRLREIELEQKRKHLDVRREQFSQVVEAISRQFTSGTPINSNVIKTMTEFLVAYKEEMDGDLSASPVMPNISANDNHAARTSPVSTGSGDKVENLKNTLLNLLNPKK